MLPGRRTRSPRRGLGQVTRFVELSHVLETGMPVYPGHPGVEFSSAGAEPPRQVMRLQIGTHSGTHIDAARHFVTNGRTIDEYPIDRFVVPAVVVRVRASGDEEIGWAALAGVLAERASGGAVLIATGWDRHWGDEVMLNHPYLGLEACEGLVASGIGLVGTDAINVDSSAQRTTHAHETLLGHDVLIVENLTNLSRLDPGQVFQCVFVPLKLASGDGSPIEARRVLWRLQDSRRSQCPEERPTRRSFVSEPCAWSPRSASLAPCAASPRSSA